MALKHHNHDYDGGSPNIPLAVGDRYYSQDLGRDFWHGVDQATRAAWAAADPAYSGDNGLLLRNAGVVSKGTGDTLNMPGSDGFCFYQARVPDSFSSVPPSTKLVDVAVRVRGSSASNMSLPSATLDGVAVNYIKMRFKEVDGATRTRAKKSGTYPYEREPSYEYVVNTIAPTKYDIPIGTLVGSSGGAFTIKMYVAVDTEVLFDSPSLLLPKEGRFRLKASVGSVVVGQSSADEVVLRGEYQTTKGTAGYLKLLGGDRLTAIFRGTRGSRIAPSKLSDPVTTPTGVGNGMGFSPDERMLGVSHTTTPFVSFYDLTKSPMLKMSDPATIPTSNGMESDWSPDGRYFAMSEASTPFLVVYDWSTGVPVKLADPSSALPNNPQAVRFSRNGRYLALGWATNSPYYRIIDLSTGNLNTTVSVSGTAPSNNVTHIIFSPDGRFMIIGQAAAGWGLVYEWINGVPTYLYAVGGATVIGLAFSLANNLAYATQVGSPYNTAWRITNDGRAAAAATAFAMSIPGYGKIDFSPGERFLAIGENGGSGALRLFDFESGFLGYPVEITGVTGFFPSIVRWSPSGRLIGITKSGTPYVEVYAMTADASKAWEIVEDDIDRPARSRRTRFF